MSLPATTDILIAGGGLSGLYLADMLTRQGIDYQLVEARDRFGGRILSHAAGGAAFDLGPAWIWPGQPRVAALAARLGLEVFAQHTSGDFRYEDATGGLQQGPGVGGMQGSLRISGGTDRLVRALVARLDADRLHLGNRLVSCAQSGTGVRATCASGDHIAARTVVLAMPPRLAAGLGFTPALPAAARHALKQTPTWMAGQAKALAIYESAFWRAKGLSGQAFSHRGPLVEIHDASPKTGGPFALFGFVSVPPQARTDLPVLRSAIRCQLERLFGPEAETPTEVVVKDWARDVSTATMIDHAAQTAHPRYGMPVALEAVWHSTLLFSGAEVAPTFGGYIEGALEAAEQAFGALRRTDETVTLEGD